MLWVVVMLACQVVDPTDDAGSTDPSEPTATAELKAVEGSAGPAILADAEPYKPLGVLETVSIQIAFSTAVMGAFVLMSALSPTYLLYGPLAVVFAVAGGVYVADRLGSKRAGLMAPLVVGVSGAVIGLPAIFLLAVGYQNGFGLLGITSQRDTDAVTTWAGAAAVVGSLLMVGGPAVAYQVVAVDKLPGDRGEATPTLWTPQPPTTTEAIATPSPDR